MKQRDISNEPLESSIKKMLASFALENIYFTKEEIELIKCRIKGEISDDEFNAKFLKNI